MLLEAIKKSYENNFSEIYNISTQYNVKLTYRLIIYKYVIDLIFGVLTPLSAISWRPVLVVEEAGVPRENHRP